MKKSTIIWGISTIAFFVISIFIGVFMGISGFANYHKLIGEIIPLMGGFAFIILMFFVPEFFILVQKQYIHTEKQEKMIRFLLRYGALFSAGIFIFMVLYNYSYELHLEGSASLNFRILFYSLFTPVGMIYYLYIEKWAKPILNIAMQLTTEEKAVKIYNISVLMLHILMIIVMVGGPIWGIIALRHLAGI